MNHMCMVCLCYRTSSVANMWLRVASQCALRWEQSSSSSSFSLVVRSVDASSSFQHIETKYTQRDNKHIRARREKFSYCWRFEQLRCSESSIALSAPDKEIKYRYSSSMPNHPKCLFRAISNCLNVLDDSWIWGILKTWTFRWTPWRTNKK